MRIYLKSELQGTQYIELAKGKYNSSWKIDSIYFLEEDFKVYEIIMAKFNKNYQPMRYTNFDKKSVKLIVQELIIFLDKIKDDNNAINSLQNMNYDIDVLSNFAINRINLIKSNELISTTIRLIEWLKETISNNDYFCVIGI